MRESSLFFFDFCNDFFARFRGAVAQSQIVLSTQLIWTHPAERPRGAEASALDASEARATIAVDERRRADGGASADDDVEEALLPVLARQEQACALDEEAIAARIFSCRE